MDSLPHVYKINSYSDAHSVVKCSAADKSPIDCAPPLQFDGPGDIWSPEDLLIAAVASCFILTFRSIARASKLDWGSLSCDVQGTLDRVDGKTCFTRLAMDVVLTLPSDSSITRVEKLLHKAEEACLITNSVSAEVELKTKIIET